MKNLFICLLASSFFLACSPQTNNKTVSSFERATEIKVSTEDEDIPEDNLEYYLNKIAGVSIIGTGAAANVTIYNQEPYFVINGSEIGRCYVSASNMVRNMNITSVKILRDLDGIAYRQRNIGGIISIKADYFEEEAETNN